MNGDDIGGSGNMTMPRFPKEMPFWQRVLCLHGYHKSETRKTGPNHKYPGMVLRNQCGRCGALL